MSEATYVYDTRVIVPQDDTLQYKVYVSKAVPRGEAMLTATVVLLAGSQNSAPETINHRVFEALADFVPAQWECTGSERSTISPGFEQVKVQMLAKIAAEENRNLEERARHASRDGLEILAIKVKSTLLQDQINQIVKALWFETVEKVNQHIVEFDQLSGRAWRIGDMVFGVPDTGKARQVISKGCFHEESEELFGELIESGLAGSEKISLITQVTLRAARPGNYSGE